MKRFCEPYFSTDKPPFDPHQYAIDGGWDFSHIETVARLGIPAIDLVRLRAYYGPGAGERAAEELVAYCRREASSQSNMKTVHDKECLDELGEWSGSAVNDDSGWVCDSCGEFIPVDGGVADNVLYRQKQSDQWNLD